MCYAPMRCGEGKWKGLRGATADDDRVGLAASAGDQEGIVGARGYRVARGVRRGDTGTTRPEASVSVPVAAQSRVFSGCVLRRYQQQCWRFRCSVWNRLLNRSNATLVP